MDADWMQGTIPVELQFYKDKKGRKVLIVDDETLVLFREELEEQQAGWRAREAALAAKKPKDAADATAQEEARAELCRLLAKAESEMERIESEHAARVKDAIVETYHILPYSYYDRMEAEDRYTTVNPDTQESVRNEDRVRDTLLAAHIKGVTRLNDKRVAITEQLDAAKVRQFSSTLATRLWKHMREWSEPSEAETFRLRLGPG